MNLIEQLGGYEKAKEALIAEQRSKNIDPVIYINGDEVLIDAIDDALLQYRRQHNIYEDGDLVVSRCNAKETRIFKYETTIGKNIVVKCKKGKCYCYPKKWFSHATDEEIKAGKRLGVS